MDGSRHKKLLRDEFGVLIRCIVCLVDLVCFYSAKMDVDGTCLGVFKFGPIVEGIHKLAIDFC